MQSQVTRMSEPEDTNSQEVQQLADKIMRYETQEKGLIDTLFGFEARDGLPSKIYKGISVGSAIAAGVAALSISPALGLGLMTVGALAVRGVLKSVFSDMHDSYKSSMAKFGHLMGVGVVSSVVSAAIGFLAGPEIGVAGSLVQAGGAMVANVAGSMALGKMFGDPALRDMNEKARALAEQQIEAREQGISGPATPQPSRHATISEEEAQALESRLKQGRDPNHSFAQAIQQREASPAQHTQRPV